MAIEIFLLSETGESGYDLAPNPSFVKKCIAEGDPYIKDKPQDDKRTEFECPVIKKTVNLVNDICYGPVDHSICEYNKLS